MAKKSVQSHIFSTNKPKRKGYRASKKTSTTPGAKTNQVNVSNARTSPAPPEAPTTASPCLEAIEDDPKMLRAINTDCLTHLSTQMVGAETTTSDSENSSKIADDYDDHYGDFDSSRSCSSTCGSSPAFSIEERQEFSTRSSTTTTLSQLELSFARDNNQLCSPDVAVSKGNIAPKTESCKEASVFRDDGVHENELATRSEENVPSHERGKLLPEIAACTELPLDDGAGIPDICSLFSIVMPLGRHQRG